MNYTSECHWQAQLVAVRQAQQYGCSHLWTVTGESDRFYYLRCSYCGATDTRPK